jgi:hypothetical protein
MTDLIKHRLYVFDLEKILKYYLLGYDDMESIYCLHLQG